MGMFGTGVNRGQHYRGEKCESLYTRQKVIECPYNIRPYTFCGEGIDKLSGACGGDSGGPAFGQDVYGNFTQLLGVSITVSGFQSDIDCTNGFTRFTKVWTYKDWIETMIEERLQYCQ